MHQEILYPTDKKELYPLIMEQLQALTQGIPYTVTNLSNASALLNEALREINWVGFYLMEDDGLILGPFQGKPACTQIPVGRGVCGTAVDLDTVMLVPDVHAFPGHIACDSASRSEIVIPLHKNGKVAAVLDIDSPIKNRFTQEDKDGLCLLIPVLERLL